MIDCYIIRSDDANRSLSLIESLKQHSHINIILIDGYYLNEEELALVTDHTWSKIRNFRNLVSGEIGSALSHSFVQTMVAEAGVGGVILEDDARIINIENFYTTCFDFLSAKNPVRILNLCDPRAQNMSTRFHLEKIPKTSSINLIGLSNRNVAYALSSRSARSISEVNFPIYSTPDWPFSSNRHAILIHPVVLHGDNNTISTIDKFDTLKREIRGNILRKIRMVLFYDYLKNYKHFEDITQYYNIVLRHRVNFFADIVLIKIDLFRLLFISRFLKLIFPNRHK
jgi:GR25 family glycosyltransferase involved in LPS biosynthesis